MNIKWNFLAIWCFLWFWIALTFIPLVWIIDYPGKTLAIICDIGFVISLGIFGFIFNWTQS